MTPPESPPAHSAPCPPSTVIGRLASFCLCIFVFALIALNILTLSDKKTHQWAYGYLQNALDLVDQRAWLMNSPTATREKDLALASEELRQGNIVLRDMNGQLSASSLALQTATGKLVAVSETLASANSRLVSANEQMVAAHQSYRGRIAAAGRKLSGSIVPRALRGATRNISSLAGEAVPYFGVAISVWSVSMDVIDACEYVRALNEMNDVLGIPHNSEGSVCGLKVPNAAQIRYEVSQDAQGVFDRARKELGAFPGSIPALPSATDMLNNTDHFVRSISPW